MLLSDNFIEKYKNRIPPFGGNGLGELVYLRCVEVNTPILCSDLVWRKAGDLNFGDKIIAFDEFPIEGRKKRQIRLGEITHHHLENAECLKINLEDGKSLICTPEHQWLCLEGDNSVLQWVQTKDLLQKIREDSPKDIYLPLFEEPWEPDFSYEAGFLAAAFDGEGSLDRVTGLAYVQVNNPMLEKVKEYLTQKGFQYSIKEKKNTKNSWGFKSDKRTYQITIHGRENVLRFLGTFRPPRLLKKFIDNLIKIDDYDKTTSAGMNGLKAKRKVKIVSIEPAGKQKIAVISTSTKTHFTGGFPSHNTYSRWLPEEGRREEWYETVRRVVEYSLSLDKYTPREKLVEEAEKIFDLIFNLKIFPAGRTLWTGGTKAAEKFPLSNFNCAFRVIDDLSAFTEVFYLLMLGCGVGFRILPEDVDKLPKLKKNIGLSFSSEVYFPGPTLEDTQSYNANSFESKRVGEKMDLIVGDSKEGWVDSLGHYLSFHIHKDVKHININTYYVRPKGAILKTFGGRASGPEGLIEMFENIHKVIQNAPEIEPGYVKLRPVDCLDILNIIAYNVVVGGVRRSSQIALFDINDTDVLDAKIGLYKEGSPNYGKYWRAMSNNSIFFKERPTKEQLLDIFKRIQNNGEPGFVNAEAANKRRPFFNGINPCAEILLDSKGVCNLTEVNINAFIGKDGTIDLYGIFEAIHYATRIGLRQTNVDLELPEWDKVQKRDRLTGVSLTGVMDATDKLDSWGEMLSLIEKLKIQAVRSAREYAYSMRIPEPLLVTTIKPSGTVSQLPTVSSGVHRSIYAPYFIRRIRITSSDPLAKAVRNLGYPVYPEVGQGPLPEEFRILSWEEQDLALEKANTWVIEFPVKVDAKQSANDETALEQFYRYLDFQKFYTAHNTSITIYFNENEVNELADEILRNWDKYVAVSFLPKDNNNYYLMPYEKISEQEYSKRLAQIVPGNLKEMLGHLEREELLDDVLDPSCASGVCPVR